MVKHQCLDRVRNSDDWVFNGIQPPIYGDITWYNNHQCMGISWKMVNLMGYEWDSRDSIHVYKKNVGKLWWNPFGKWSTFTVGLPHLPTTLVMDDNAMEIEWEMVI